MEQPKADYWAGYYDFLINEGSYKFWAVFQVILEIDYLIFFGVIIIIYVFDLNHVIIFASARDRGSSDLQRFRGSLLRQSESADHGRLFRRYIATTTKKTSLASARGPRQTLRRTRHRHVSKDNRGR